MSTIRSSHIAIGTELTSGQTLNTNSRTIAEYLQIRGVKNQVHIVTPDTKSLILESFDFVSPHSDWIFVYGGLGPTTDDFTRNVVAEWAQTPLVLDSLVWEHIQNILKGRGYPIRDFQKQQAFFPEGAVIMENSKGTAHGFHLHARGKEIFVLPGPPKEVQSILENYLKNWIDNHSQTSDSQITEIWNTMGLGESEVAFQIENVIKDFDVTVGYRIHLPYIEVKISYLKSQSQNNSVLVNNIQRTLAPILVYKDKYPYPDFFKNLFAPYPSIMLIDEMTQGGLATDLKNWVPQWENKKITYRNHGTEIALSDDAILLAVTKTSAPDEVDVVIKSRSLNIHFMFRITPVTKLPDERRPLYTKEMVYKEILEKLR